jgi:pentatricopeptide repeat protein
LIPSDTPKQKKTQLEYLKIKTQNGDISTYNAILLKLTKARHDPVPKSFALYQELLHCGMSPNTFTFPCLVKLLANSRALAEGKIIHGHIVKLGFENDAYIRNNLIRLYAFCGCIGIACKLFDLFPGRDMVSWTILMSGYTKVGMFRESVNLFIQMMDLNLEIDAVTVVSAFSACSKLGDLNLGKELHKYIKTKNVNLDVYAWNALVDMYAKCGDITCAYEQFKKMPERNIVTWNSMISGFVHAREFTRALSVFRKMQTQGITPDGTTFVSMLSACTNLGALDTGRWVHLYLLRLGFEPEGVLGNALINMYAKCGAIDHAVQVFEGMPQRDVFTFSCLIVGFAMHGKAENALDLFFEMLAAGVDPNEVTFIGVLTACSHAGLVKEGLLQFDNMVKIYGLNPRVEHYGCVVDMLGRVGLLEKAEKFVEEMPIEPDSSIWGSLLAACRMHGKVEMGERVMRRALEMQSKEDGDYVIMSNLYASSNRHYDSIQMRKEMRREKLKKIPGCSSIEIDGTVYEFRAGNKFSL